MKKKNGRSDDKEKLIEEGIKLKIGDEVNSQLPSHLSSSARDRLAELEAELEPENDKPSISEAPKRESNHKMFWTILIVTVILSKLPFSELIFTPLTQFATMVHEMSHAVMTILTGGSVSGMTIVADGQGHGGLTFCHGGIPFIHVQAGYLGTAIVGAVLVFLGQYKHLARPTLVAIGIFTILGALVFMGAGLFSTMALPIIMSMIWAGLLAFLTIMAGLKLDEKKANFVLLFLAVHTAMDSLRSIALVMGASIIPIGTFSDATVMQRDYFLPAVFWSLSWALFSLALMAVTFWFCFFRKKKSG